MKLAPLLALVALLIACGGDDARRSSEPTVDARLLLVQLADLPAGYSLVPGETIPTPLAVVLRDPWTGNEALLRRERVAGHQTAFWSPERRRIDCQAAVYRSSAGATRAFRTRLDGFERFLHAWAHGRRVDVGEIGHEARAQRYEVEGSEGFVVAWRHDNVLASCGSLGPRRPDPVEVVRIARLQEERIAAVLAARSP
jgi:hypothetical protein